METIKINTSSSYEITVGAGVMDDAGTIIANKISQCKIAVISDDKVFDLYGNKLIAVLKAKGYNVFSIAFPHGEKSKNLSTVSDILCSFKKNKMTRCDLVCALGGGVTGDMAGFSSSVYLRGIPYVQFPTTLLAAVDSSVGGKTGIDFDGSKNMVGSFYQPIAVICDTDLLRTLTPDDYNDGLSEALKYGVIYDKNIFSEIESGNYDIDVLIRECIESKKHFVEKDEFDKGERMLLNYGHTSAHALEKLSSFSISHGSAVGTGMCIAARAAEKLGVAKVKCSERIEKAVSAMGIPVTTRYSSEQLFNAAMDDKKRQTGTIYVIMPEMIGKAVAVKMDTDELIGFFNAGI